MSKKEVQLPDAMPLTTRQKLNKPCDNKPDGLICRQKRYSGKYRLKKQIEDAMTAELMRNQRIN